MFHVASHIAADKTLAAETRTQNTKRTARTQENNNNNNNNTTTDDDNEIEFSILSLTTATLRWNLC